MRTRFKNSIHLFALVVIALAAVMLTGCGASLTVYDYTENGLSYSEYRLDIDAETVGRMEESAIRDSSGEKYNVPDYFYKLFSGFGYELVDASLDGGAFSASYRKQNFGDTDLVKEGGEKTRFVTVYNDNPFFRSYNAVSPDPFNGLREVYDAVTSMQSSTIIQKLKNGNIAVDKFGDVTVSFPPVQDAFPYLQGMDASGLLLNYLYTGSARMNSSGRKIKLDGGSAYVFSRYFDTTERQIALEYKRPIVWGWYLVALAAGGITLAVIIIVTRKKKKKEKTTLLDRFPYNPEEYRDYDNHLPM